MFSESVEHLPQISNHNFQSAADDHHQKWADLPLADDYEGSRSHEKKQIVDLKGDPVHKEDRSGHPEDSDEDQAYRHASDCEKHFVDNIQFAVFVKQKYQ